MPPKNTTEHQRLADSEAGRADWKNWGPYLSERAWGTVREDYSPDGEAWDYFPHDHARSRAYRWNEDGLGGFCNRYQNICLAVAVWNEVDPILKERLFGLSGHEGNHGEDVKEYYFYLDGTPTHSYMKMLYKYPQVAFPYQDLVERNRVRGREEAEYELIDALRETFEDQRYFDVFIEYAKADEEDILCRITAINRGPEPAPIHILPHLWYRNNWSWNFDRQRPRIHPIETPLPDITGCRTHHQRLGERWWYVEGEVPLLFTENETNDERLYGTPNPGPYIKDAFHEAIVSGNTESVNPQKEGSKVAAHFKSVLAPGDKFTVRLRFTDHPAEEPFGDFDRVFERRIQEADEFYTSVQTPGQSEDDRNVQRQALVGLLWNKQFYYYRVQRWQKGDATQPAPAESRVQIRNAKWTHFDGVDVLSMPDKWEYPWFAAWDLAFHTIPIAMLDPEWAKEQLLLLLREWYMHPNGQLPAYEWAFGDVNPPVHAWACWQVYELDRTINGRADTLFLERAFHKLLLNFTWWVNREDRDGNNIFQGGFLGLDNIGVFDRSKELPTGGHLDQADGTAWMAMYCLDMLTMALELARTHIAYEDVATKFFEHFIYIANSFHHMGEGGKSLWDEEDGFFYDALHTPDDETIPLKIRSFVGLIPIFATASLEPELLEKLPRFKQRMEWFIKYRPGLVKNVATFTEAGAHGHYQLSIVDRKKLERILRRVFDPEEFLSEHGLRSLSRYHASQPYEFRAGDQVHRVSYEPAESNSGLFGGNSNWRGPVWFPVNYLVIESLRVFYDHYGETFKVEVPKGSGNWINLDQAADDLCRRMARIFQRSPSNGNRRPVFGGEGYFQNDPHWRDYVPFYEYFHGDNGSGLGASHQTGWTALVAKMMQDTRANH